MAALEMYQIRLDIIKDQVKDHIIKCQLMLREGKCSSKELREAKVPLSAKNKRYISEIHLFLQNTANQDSDLVTTHTNVQMEADILIEEIEETLKSLQCTERLENVTSKLPKLELIKFGGDILKWHEFWDRFASSIHSRNIRNVDKLAYLNNSLVGKAKEAVVGLDTTDKNYDIALNVLRERFGKKAVVIDAHYSELFKLQSKGETVVEARRVINEIDRHLRVLNSLGENIHGAHLRNVIIEKFPQDIIKELRMRMTSGDESIPFIRKHLEHIITARETSDQKNHTSFSTEVLHIQDKKNYYMKKEIHRPRFNTMHTQNQNTDYINRKRKINQQSNNYGKRSKMSCIFCGGSHFNDECSNVVSIEARKKKLVDRCYICLRRGHRSVECTSNKKCVICGQLNSHNRALCPKKQNTQMYNVKTFQAHEDCLGILQTAIVRVEDSKNCRLLLDTGSQRTYVTTNLVKELNLPTKDTNRLMVYTFGTNKPKEIESCVVDFKITTRRGKTYTLQANVMPYITNEVLCPNDLIPNNSDYDMADDGSLGTRIDILIGNDYYGMFMTSRIKMIDVNLYMIDSSFGWIYSGQVKKECNEQDMTVVTYCDSSMKNYFTKLDLPLKDVNVSQLWELEAIGICDPPKSTHQEEVVKHFNQSVVVKDGRYQVKWPYIVYPPNLPTNFGLAIGRLKSIINRMDQETIKTYDEIFKQQLSDGIIEIISSQERKGPIHYLPHHGVSHEGKKLRIVLDASAKTKNESSLNECLYKGPLMLEDLTALLIKFRQHCIAITADIEKAFLQLGLQPEDRDVTRMLWLKNIVEGVHDQNLLHLRFCRVPFGIISSPFLLSATIHHHLNQSDKKTNMMEKVVKRCYVDNLVTGTDSKDEALKLYHDTKETFEEISMNIRDWNSNDKRVLNEIPEEFREKNSNMTNVLGMKWDTTKDVLVLKGINKFSSETQKKEVVTKRQVLRVLASVFDPCGLMSPIVLPCKIFLQNLWKTKENWDTKLDEERNEQWLKLHESLSVLNQYEFTRFLDHLGATDLELHCFTDASKYAYAAVVYLRACKRQQVSISLIMSKSRLTPLKDNEGLQIPRLELLGCLIGTRLLRYVKKTLDLNITRQILWTDSTIVLDWIASNKLLPPFVTRRVEEIKKNNDIDFRYVDTRQNPADIASRKEGILRINMWLEGPEFLKKDKGNWPIRPQPGEHIKALAVGEGLVGPPENREGSLHTENSDRDSSLDITENMGRNGEYYEGEGTESQVNQRMSNEEEVDIDERTLKDKIRKIQEIHYPEELKGKNTSLRLNLNLFKDNEGLLRCEGRIGKSTVSYDTQCPILLPGNCDLTHEIVQDIHVMNYHVGASHTLSLVRQQYWIPKGRSEVKKVLRKCPACVKHGGGSFKLPEMPQLPKERVNYEKPFDYVGMDYFGPILVTYDGKTQKAWVFLFTCLAIRAIHMEMVKDMTAEESLLALRRFIATRGVPIHVTSDNAPQFKIISEVLDSEYCIKQKIKWRFIPELAPWHGGFYERLVGLVKNCLKRTLEKHMLNDTQMLTVIKEVEGVLNNRPLTYVSTDHEHILKPNDFLTLGKCLAVEESGKEMLDKERVTKTNLVEGWKRGMYILKDFEKMFVNQYLLSLRERSHRNKEARVNVKRLPRVGEIVQIKDEISNRMSWKVGKIDELVKGGDGQVRVALVKVGEKIYRRSIAHLYPLEVEDEDDEEKAENIENNTVKATDKVEITKRASFRNAAARAKEKIRKWTRQLFVNVTNVNV